MIQEHSELAQTLLDLPQTDARLEQLPPNVRVAVAHDDHVMLFLLKVGNVDQSCEILFSVITLAESADVFDSLRETSGLVKKSFAIDDAYRLKEMLESVGTDVELVLPT